MPTLPPITKGGEGGEDAGGKFQARNWRKRDVKKLAPQERSKYLAYEEPPKEVQEAQASSKKRLIELRKQRQQQHPGTPTEERDEREKHELLIGQLKAAEARNRLRIMRLRYQANRAQEISHLIACQPSALKAVRLQALLPPTPERKVRIDVLDKLERDQCESLLEDDEGLLTKRVA